MKQVIEVDLDSSSEKIFNVLNNLEAYENLLGFVDCVEALEPEAGIPCWLVTLRAKVGPFSRLKKLRMARTEEKRPEVVRFSRREIDDKNHSDWELLIHLEDQGDNRCSVYVEVSYSGRFWSGPLQSVFNSHVDTAKHLLQQTFSAGGEDL
tara:strand:+ start:1067 stop:1519 length:453 start_codon:yes stop_codon:yes gene_type:complete